MSDRPHRGIIVAGPNGAGKSTFLAQYLVERGDPDMVILNADEIHRAMSVKLQLERQSPVAAGRELLRRLSNTIESRANFVLETTLSGLHYANLIPVWQRNGYRVALHYLRLPSVAASIARVQRRVAAGGHDIPVVDLERRFARSLANFDVHYRLLVDEWYLYESSEGEIRLIDSGYRYSSGGRNV